MEQTRAQIIQFKCFFPSNQSGSTLQYISNNLSLILQKINNAYFNLKIVQCVLTKEAKFRERPRGEVSDRG